MKRDAQIKAIADALDMVGDESCVYLNRKTGQLVFVRDEEWSEAEEWDGEDDAFLDDYPDWQREEIRKARDVMDSEDYLPLPDKHDLDDYGVMRDFCRSVTDEGLRDELYNAIGGQGAFRYFKDVVRRRGVEQDWYRFKEKARERIAAEWLEENGITEADGLEIRQQWEAPDKPGS